MNLKQLTSLSYLFDVNPPASFAFLYSLASAFLLLIIAGIAVHIFLKLKKGDSYLRNYLKKSPWKLYTFGLVGLALLWFRHEGIPYFSMRLWPLLLLAGFVVWFVFYLVSSRKIKAGRLAEAERIRMQRYQP